MRPRQLRMESSVDLEMGLHVVLYTDYVSPNKVSKTAIAAGD
jgi:hypothetical protein